MRSVESFLPRLLVLGLLVGSISMLIPVVRAAALLMRGQHVTLLAWGAPIALLAAGSVLSWLLTRRQVPLRLYVVAFALWVLCAAYFFARVGGMLATS